MKELVIKGIKFIAGEKKFKEKVKALIRKKKEQDMIKKVEEEKRER